MTGDKLRWDREDVFASPLNIFVSGLTVTSVYLWASGDTFSLFGFYLEASSGKHDLRIEFPTHHQVPQHVKQSFSSAQILSCLRMKRSNTGCPFKHLYLN